MEQSGGARGLVLSLQAEQRSMAQVRFERLLKRSGTGLSDVLLDANAAPQLFP